MERFVSNYTKKVDGKGRVSVPPQFRTILQRSGDDQIYAQLSLETHSVIAGGASLLAQLEARLEKMDPFSPEYDDWATHIYACLLYTSPSPRDQRGSRMPSSA